MSHTNTDMNCLPVPTWNRLAVNFAPDAAALPAVPSTGFGEAISRASALPAGVCSTESDLAGFAAESGLGASADAFLAANANSVCHLAVSAGAKVSEPVIFETELDAVHPNAVSYITVDAAEGSELTIVQAARGDAQNGISASLIRIRAAARAHVKLVQVQLLGTSARRWNAVAVEEDTSARVEQVRIELGANIAACGTRTQLSGSHSEYDLDAVYFGAGSDILDFNDVSVHTGRDTLCEMHTAGVLAGSADKILRGTVDFRRGAQRGVGHESEDVLLFSPTVRNRTAPLILCGEEQVEGQHAASVGRLDEAKLYYLRSRGLSEAQARRLMVDARFAPAIEKIPLEELRAEVREEAARRLDDGNI